jgi:hypothetical protein
LVEKQQLKEKNAEKRTCQIEKNLERKDQEGREPPSALTRVGPEQGRVELWGRTLIAAPVSTR